MAATLIFLILSIFSTVEAQQRSSNISLTSSLSPTTNSSWLSRSGLYAFGFYRYGGSGYAVGVFMDGIPEKTVVWTANRDDPPVSSNATLAFLDGSLILQQPQGQNTNITDVSEPVSAASMLDSGNFVLYNSGGGIIWQSFDYPTDTILPGQRLSAGKELFSSTSETDHSTGIFRLKMQNDGNLVQYPVETPDTARYAYFASGTDGAGKNVTLNLDDNGHLYLLNSTGTNIRNIFEGESRSNGTIYRMTIDVDGIFRVYSRALDPSGNWSILRYSSANPCEPKGLCGLNAYCFLNDNKADCRCLPGFEFVNTSKWNSGCERNFVAGSCKDANGSTEYVMRRIENTGWEEVSYATIESNRREDCEEACLQDCNCEAALYNGGRCYKQRLPLRYGRRSLSETQMALIKIGRSKQEPAVPPKETMKEPRIYMFTCSVD